MSAAAERAVETPLGTFVTFENDLISRQLARFGGHTRNELAMVTSFVRAGDVVVDVGAHIGTFAVPLGRVVGERGRVYAFEALADHHRLLRCNVDLNGLGRIVSAVNAAVSDRVEILSCVRKEGNSGATFLTSSEGRTPVRSVVLDDWWTGVPSPGGRAARIALIKVDVEGMEAKVLRGARKILAADAPVLYLEYSPPHLVRAGSSATELAELLGSHGYHCFANLGRRNSSNDQFRMGRLGALSDLGEFGDVLAVHPESDRYPRRFAGAWATRVTIRLWEAARALRRRLRRG